MQCQWRQSSCPQYNPGKCINSSPPSAAYMRQWTRSSLIQVMAVRLVRRQAITRINAGLLSTGLLGTYFSEIWIGILSFSFKKMQLKMSSAKWRPFCPGGMSWYLFCWLYYPYVCVWSSVRTYSNGISRYIAYNQTRHKAQYVQSCKCPIQSHWNSGLEGYWLNLLVPNLHRTQVTTDTFQRRA